MFPRYEYRNAPVEFCVKRSLTPCQTRFHKHLELLFVRSSSLDVTIDGTGYTLQAGDVYVAFPNIPHALKGSDSAAYILFLDFELCPFFHDILLKKVPVCPVLRAHALDPAVGAIVDRMARLSAPDTPMGKELLTAYANALLGELLGKMELTERSRDNALLHRLNLYILDNYTHDLTLDRLSHDLGYSKFYISHLISSTYGCNLRSLINSYRISMARHLLASGSVSIGDAAYACGFKNQSTFNRVFLQYCGTTPSAYRRHADRPPEQPRVYIR